ncbi:YggS family pyridoxal phosphate-dependent enzyme [Acidobacteriota bacterium]
MIKDNVKKILQELPAGVKLVAAAKTRTTEEIFEALDAGVQIIGENYVQEAQDAFQVVGHRAQWHFIGHLQTNKVKKAVEIFDVIETVDSFKIAGEIDKRCQQTGKIMPVLIEINSGREKNKNGVFPEEAIELVQKISHFKNVKIVGLMTMGPFFGKPEDARPYFAVTHRLFKEMKNLPLPGVEMTYLSMGMTNSFKVAIEEGANIIRIGTNIFGART